MKGHVYIYGGEGIYKIGRAKNVEKRLQAITKPPFPCTLVHVFPTEQPAKLESALHRRFKKSRMNGEWFSLTDGDIAFLKASEPAALLLQPKPPKPKRTTIRRKPLVPSKGPFDTIRLDQLIKAKYGTQNAFADALGVSRQYVSQIVNGEFEPTLDRLVQFSDLLDVSTDKLLGKEIALAA